MLSSASIRIAAAWPTSILVAASSSSNARAVSPATRANERRLLSQRLLEAKSGALALAGLEQRLGQLHARAGARLCGRAAQAQLEPLRSLRGIAEPRMQARERRGRLAGGIELVQLA